MSATYDVKTNLIFTGGHDGTVLAWHFETGFVKFHLHEMDKTCVSKDYIRESKSVDCLQIMKKQRILLSGSADQTIRFWDLNDLTSGKPPLFKFCDTHETGEALTALAIDSLDEKLVTADTKGRFKLWDISAVDLRAGLSNEETRSKIRLCWYINAHKSAVNTLQIVETYRDEVDLFIVSAGADWNILLHRMSNGARIGQFSQDATWNIKTLN
jgi:WD40 repeat protein